MKIELSDQQLQVIDQALQQLPYNVAAPIIEHINQQKQKASGAVTLGISLQAIGDHDWRKNYINCNVINQNH